MVPRDLHHAPVGRGRQAIPESLGSLVSQKAQGVNRHGTVSRSIFPVARAGDTVSPSGEEPSMASPKFMTALGPGLLFAGAAVGTSHLVQSTRAGAVFGLGLLAVVILANVIKYPAFRFGAHYAAATGRSLVAGYRDLGWFPPLLLGAILILADGFAVAALSLVTAGIVKVVFGLEVSILTAVALVMAAAGAFLIIGGYHWLERLNKLFMAVLTVSTLIATVLVLPKVDWSFYPASAPPIDMKAMLFVAALAGWMPTAMESSIFASLWTVEKAKDMGTKPSLEGVLADFNIGYWGTAILAICFLLLGAGIMHSGAVEPADTAPAFAAQIMALYRDTLGAWAVPVIGIAALSVMFTTCLTAFDGLVRAFVAVVGALRAQPQPDQSGYEKKAYAATLLGFLVAAFLLLYFFLGGFKGFVDFVTSLAFLTAPVLAFFNHRVMMGSSVPDGDRPAPYLMHWSRAGIALMLLFAAGYLFLVFT
ncbi:NRAMP family divalent metal transporter [Kordiimonas lacus]|nr:divalent metal cation transporter [Kordiimonas lacus]